MATIRKGKRKGEKVTIRQWCNDWIMTDEAGIVSPTNIILDKEEMARIALHKNNGIMFGLFTLSEDGTFKRIRRSK